MKTTKIDTITSNEEVVRLAIYEGRVPLDRAGEELIALYKAQRDAARSWASFWQSEAWRHRRAALTH